jgi:hypothetical protein
MSSKMIMPANSRILTPGPALVQGARALEDPKSSIGIYPYQWLFPGPHSRMVWPNNAVAITGPGNTDLILEYAVPDGMIFSLRGVVWGFIGTGWSEGSSQLVFNTTVTAAGTRNVDFLNNWKTHAGSLESPYPILGRLEFAPLDVLRVQVTNTAGPATGNAFAHLVGHVYPQSEAA